MTRIASVSASLAMAAAWLLAPLPARAETWCLRSSDIAQTRICAFSSAQECFRTARVNPVGNICEQEGAARSRSPAVTERSDRHRDRRSTTGSAESE